MGIAKHDLVERWEQGYDSIGDKYVCAQCVTDTALQQFIEEHAEEPGCSYCERATERDPISVPADDILALVVDGIRFEWSAPVNELYHESAEGGFQGNMVDTEELLLGEAYFTDNDALREDIAEAIDTAEWCQKDYYALHEEDALSFGWSEFTEQTKHRTRYLFLIAPEQHEAYAASESISPANMLDEIGRVIASVGIIQPLERGTRFVRARVHAPDEHYTTASELGPPPEAFANYSNRMSPAGIPMFYGARDEATALAELGHTSDVEVQVATLAVFETLHDLTVVDLTSLPDVPSLFDMEQRHLRPAIMFLHDFVGDLTKPIERDDRMHTEYVPTQIVTEYFRHLLGRLYGSQIHGVLYGSSRRTGGVNCVLFCSNEQCCDEDAGAEPNAECWLIKRGAATRVTLE